MENISQLTIDDLKNLIEQKIIEVLGDPDISLNLREDFKKELKDRLKRKVKQFSHQEVIKRFG